MEHYQTLQHMNSHAISVGILSAVTAMAVTVAVIVKLFRSF